jgi:RNA recognition motif-containing protein
MGDKYGPNDGAEPADDNSDVAGKVFVGGLSWQTTVDGLRYYFEKYGQLADVALMNDKRSGQPRGFGFVTFKDPAGINIIKFKVEII